MKLIACFLASLLPITFLIFILLWLHFFGGGFVFIRECWLTLPGSGHIVLPLLIPFHTVNLIFADFCWLSFSTMMFNGWCLIWFIFYQFTGKHSHLIFGIDFEAVTINHNFIVNSWSFQILSSAFWLPYWLFF